MKERQLTQSEVDALQPGELVRVTWSGGNGPHLYEIVRQNGLTYARTLTMNPTMHVLNFVGEYPLTQVWATGELARSRKGDGE